MKDSDWNILYELYKTPNITKVAKRLYITQPSLTKRLQGIEEEFQIKIVNRTTKGVEFTKEGELLAEKAAQYIEFINQTRQELRSIASANKEVIVIGSAYTYSKYVLTDLLFDYSLTHNVQFEVITEPSNLLFRKICDGDIDIAFVKGDYEGDVKMTKVEENTAYIMTNKEIDFEELPEMVKIDYKISDKTKSLLDNWWKEKYESSSAGTMNVGYIDVAWQLVSRGLGYTCCFLPENYKNEYNMTLTPMVMNSGETVKRNTWMVINKNKAMSKTIEDFAKYIEEKTAELMA